MSLSPDFLAMLRCSESKQELIHFPAEDGAAGHGFLFCPASRLRYPIDEHGIPVLLVEEAIRVDDQEHARLVARARELGLARP